VPAGLDGMRTLVRGSLPLRRFEPRRGSKWKTAAERRP
jgi:hypothetical protein